MEKHPREQYEAPVTGIASVSRQLMDAYWYETLMEKMYDTGMEQAVRLFPYDGIRLEYLRRGELKRLHTNTQGTATALKRSVESVMPASFFEEAAVTIKGLTAVGKRKQRVIAKLADFPKNQQLAAEREQLLAPLSSRLEEDRDKSFYFVFDLGTLFKPELKDIIRLTLSDLIPKEVMFSYGTVDTHKIGTAE